MSLFLFSRLDVRPGVSPGGQDIGIEFRYIDEMKFKMGSSKSGGHADNLHDSTSTSSSSGVPNVNQNSGIYDVSRMTNLRTPLDSKTASEYTTTRAREVAKNDQKRSELIRGLLLAITIPLVAGAAYLIISGQDLPFGQKPVVDLPIEPTEPDRVPAASATLPVVQVDSTPVLKTTVSLNEIATNAPLVPNAAEVVAKPLAIVLDENGVMSSPFSVELNEEGQEVARLEFKDYVAFLPPLPMGYFEKVRSLKEAQPTPEFLSLWSAAGGKSVFKFEPDEVRRFSILRGQAPEVRNLIEVYEYVARSQMEKQPIAVDSFQSRIATPQQIQAALTDLFWLEPTLVLSQAIGTDAYDARLKASVLEWVKSYVPNGRIEDDIRLSKVAMAFEGVKDKMTADEIEKCKTFFLNLADIQFIQMKAHKLYDPAHALHINFMATLGAATKDPRILNYAAIQYGFHIARSPIFKLNAFDSEHFVIMDALLNTTVTFERLGFRFYQAQKGQQSLSHGISILLNSSPSEGRNDYVNALATAAYFDSALFPALAKASTDSKNRFATAHGTTLAALRKSYSSLNSSLKPTDERIPSSVQPKNLPPKRGR